MQAPSRCCRAVDWDRPAANDRPAIGSGDDHRIGSTRYFLSSVLARAGRGDRNRLPVSLLGHTAAAWPVSVISSRRLIATPKAQERALPTPSLAHGNWQAVGSLADIAARPDDVRFSNRPFGVKHFQTIRRCSVDVAHGLALLFGIGTQYRQRASSIGSSQ